MKSEIYQTAKGAQAIITCPDEITAETVITCELVGLTTFKVSRYESSHPLDKIFGFNEQYHSIDITLKGNISAVKSWLDEKRERCRERDFLGIESRKNAQSGKGERSDNLVFGKNNW